MGYSPWGRKELDTTEQLSTHTHYSPESQVHPIWSVTSGDNILVNGEKSHCPSIGYLLRLRFGCRALHRDPGAPPRAASALLVPESRHAL